MSQRWNLILSLIQILITGPDVFHIIVLWHFSFVNTPLRNCLSYSIIRNDEALNFDGRCYQTDIKRSVRQIVYQMIGCEVFLDKLGTDFPTLTTAQQQQQHTLTTSTAKQQQHRQQHDRKMENLADDPIVALSRNGTARNQNC